MPAVIHFSRKIQFSAQKDMKNELNNIEDKEPIFFFYFSYRGILSFFLFTTTARHYHKHHIKIILSIKRKKKLFAHFIQRQLIQNEKKTKKIMIKICRPNKKNPNTPFKCVPCKCHNFKNKNLQFKNNTQFFVFEKTQNAKKHTNCMENLLKRKTE